jgi:hypothetical protein
MSLRFHVRVVLTALTSAIVCASGASAHSDHSDRSKRRHRHHERAPLQLEVLGSFATGLGVGAAEIVAYDSRSQRLFVVNAQASSVDILDISAPSSPQRVATIDLSATGSPNSVAVHRGLVAIAIQNHDKTLPGIVGLYTVNGELIKTVTAGALPDMLTFTSDGEYLLIANEGEPNGYGAGVVDPEGSVTIIRMPRHEREWNSFGEANVRTASFTKYNGQEAALRSSGIRIFGPGATAAQDFEPEYIAVTPDSRTAYVTLQENNAIAVIDIERAAVKALHPLGFKDHAAPPTTIATYEWTDLPSIGRTAAGQPLDLGGFSGLAYEGTTRDGKLKFIAHTDRGPNAEPTGILRPFLLPKFTPRLVRFTLDPGTGHFDLTQQIPLLRSNGQSLTGLPNTALSSDPNQAYNDEVAVDLFGKEVGKDPLGGDFEAIVVDDDGSFWLADEYRPAIYHFDTKGRLIERLIPIGTHAAAGLAVPAPGKAGVFGTEALPATIAQRRQNRGMEALAEFDGKLYAFVQSPIRNPATLGNAALNALRNVRVVEFDPLTRATRQFIYEMDNPPSTGELDTRADKIGDAVASAIGEFYVVERDDDAVSKDELATITKKIYKFVLADATDVSSLDTLYPVVRGGTTVTLSLDQMTAAELVAIGVKPIAKRLHVDLATAGYAGVEKVEGLALLDNGKLAVINDNDFGVAQIVVDNATGRFTRAPGYEPEPVILGLIDVPGLDASDRDSSINIRNWPLRGLYLPDSIAAYKAKGRTWLVTANEGDARDWPGFAEEVRVSALTLDSDAFPDATLKQNANLGRQTVTRSLGDANADGQYEALYTLGGRSFSIWSSDGTLAFDSGSDFERITAAADPEHFNASNDNSNFDDRSDNKGPEPEGIAIGEIDDRMYAFIGLERVGGVMMYDITDPRSPVFVDYINNRDFDAQSGDLGPEGLTFIPAKSSPIGRPLLVVANEVSGTVTLYKISSK